MSTKHTSLQEKQSTHWELANSAATALVLKRLLSLRHILADLPTKRQGSEDLPRR